MYNKFWPISGLIGDAIALTALSISEYSKSWANGQVWYWFLISISIILSAYSGLLGSILTKKGEKKDYWLISNQLVGYSLMVISIMMALNLFTPRSSADFLNLRFSLLFEFPF